MLAGSGLPFGELDGHAGADHLVAEQAVDWLSFGSLEELVVLVVPAPRSQSIPAFLGRFFVGIAKEIELELRGHHGSKPHALRALNLATQDRARSDSYELVGDIVDEIAEHECRLL